MENVLMEACVEAGIELPSRAHREATRQAKKLANREEYREYRRLREHFEGGIF